MLENDDDDHVYVYLDFNEKLAPNIFANKVFLRVANLHKSNPLVQINDLVFKGSFDECVGTNVFLEEIEDPPLKNNLFEKDTQIQLKPVVSQTKIIKLKQMKLPRKVLSSKQVNESVSLNLNQDYNTVLDKLEHGMLNVEDIAQKEVENVIDEEYDDIKFNSPSEKVAEPEKEVESYLSLLGTKSQSALLEAKYERLKRLARRPVKRMKSPELVEECEKQYKEAYEYHNLERQVLQSSDAFRTASGPIIEESLVGGVDIDRCVLQGLIIPFNDLNRVLTAEERSKILTLDNFENLSIPARYLVLKECIGKIEEIIETSASDTLKEKDVNGRTIKDICDIFRRLAEALKQHMTHTSDGVKIKFKADLVEKRDDDYIKYKYKPSEAILNVTDFLDENDWTDDDSQKANSDESGEENFDEDSNVD